MKPKLRAWGVGISLDIFKKWQLLEWLYLWFYPQSDVVSLVVQLVKNRPAVQETRIRSLGQEDPLEKKWQPTPVFLLGEVHGQRSLVGYSPGVAKTQLSVWACYTIAVWCSLRGSSYHIFTLICLCCTIMHSAKVKYLFHLCPPTV